MEGLIRASVKNFVGVFMIIVLILVIGWVALSRLPVDLLPNLELPILMIMVDYKGASPQEVEENVTKLIESVALMMNNVDSVQSTSSEGRSRTIITFKWGVDIDKMASEVRERLDRIADRLPDQASKPVIYKFDPNMLPIMSIALSGMNDLARLREIAEDELSKALSQVPGVALVDVGGGYSRSIFIDVDKQKITSLGILPTQIIQAIAQENQNVSVGKVYVGNKSINLRFISRYQSPEDIANTVITTRGNYAIKLKDIANVYEGIDKENRTIARVNGKETVILQIYKQPGRNTVEVSREVKKKLKELEGKYPGIEFNIVADQAESIESSIAGVRDTALQGAILAILVVFAMLVSMKETLIIGLSIPLSIIFTFVVMYFLNVSLNIVSLAGLALGVGMMVDSSIVVIENIFFHRTKEGLNLVDSAIIGTKEVVLAITASILTTIAVFFPIVFLQGFTAQLFKDLSITVTVSLLASLATAVTIVPSLASRKFFETGWWGKMEEKLERSKLRAFVENILEKMEDFHERILRFALNRKKMILGFAFLFVILSIALLVITGIEFMPTVDTGDARISLKLPTATRLEVTSAITKDIEDILLQIPELDKEYTILGSGILRGLGFAREDRANISIKLVPKTKRYRSVFAVLEDMSKRLRNIPGDITIQPGSGMMGGPMRGLGAVSGGANTIEIKVKGNDLEEIISIANDIVNLIKQKFPTLRNPTTDQEETLPEYRLVFDRKRASMLGISASSPSILLSTGFGGQTVGFFYQKGKEIPIVVRFSDTYRYNLDSVRSLYLPTMRLEMIPLENIVDIEEGKGPRGINREGGLRTVTVRAELWGQNLFQVTELLKRAIKENIYIPQGVILEYGGSYQDTLNTFRDLLLALGLSILLIYSIMALQFNSFLDPFIVMFSVPFGFAGVVLFLFITRTSFSTISFIGLIVMSGIVVNNGIVLVDYINQLRERGMNLREAVVRGAVRRLRPVLMTALTTILGLIPLSLGLGESGELYAPLGRAILGGLLVSTVFTLVIVPVIYEALNKIRGKREA